MNPALFGQLNQWGTAISNALGVLGSKLGVAAAHVYWVFVKEMFIEGAEDMLFALLSVVYVVWFIKRLNRYYAAECKDKPKEPRKPQQSFSSSYSSNDDDDDDPEAVFLMIMGVVAVVAVLVFCLCLACGIPKLFNPEYMAIQQIVTMVQGVSK